MLQPSGVRHRVHCHNAFGTKKALFKRVLIKFEHDNQKPTLAQLEALDDPVAAISTLFGTVIAQRIADTEKKRNLIINDALALAIVPQCPHF